MAVYGSTVTLFSQFWAGIYQRGEKKLKQLENPSLVCKVTKVPVALHLHLTSSVDLLNLVLSIFFSLKGQRIWSIILGAYIWMIAVRIKEHLRLERSCGSTQSKWSDLCLLDVWIFPRIGIHYYRRFIQTTSQAVTAEHCKNSSYGICTETKVSKVCSLLSAESWRAARFASQDLPVMHFCVVSLATLMFLEKASREFSLWLSLEWDWLVCSFLYSPLVSWWWAQLSYIFQRWCCSGIR